MTDTLSRPTTATEIAPDEEIELEPAHLDLGSAEFRERAFATYAEMREKAPATRTRISVGDSDAEQDPFFNRDVVLVTGYEAGTEALLDERLTVDRVSMLTEEQKQNLPQLAEEFRPLSRSILSVDPPDHTRLRRLVQPAFANRAMEALRPRIRQIAEDLLDAAEREATERGESAPNRTMELIGQFAYPLPMTVIAEMLGVPEGDREQVRIWSENLLSSQRGGDRQEEIRANLRAFIDYLRGLFEEKRRNPTDDLTTRLVQAEEDGDKLDEDELLSMIFILIVAGHITTVNLIANGVFALLTHPDELAKVKADPSLVKGLVEETLRFYGPAETTTARIAKEEMEVGGVTVERGEPLFVVIGAADRDPARFVDPDRFDVTRPDANRHIAFGKGIHACLGAPLARLEGQVAFALLLQRLPQLALGVPQEEIRWRPSFLRSLESLPVTF